MPKGIKGFQKGHKQFNTGKTHFKKGHHNKHSEETKQKMCESNKNNKTGIENGIKTRFKKGVNTGWEILGGEKEYRNLHYWVEKQLGKPTKCEHCGKDGLTGKLIHWANKSNEYKKDINDWVRLCARCHFYKDKRK